MSLSPLRLKDDAFINLRGQIIALKKRKKKFNCSPGHSGNRTWDLLAGSYNNLFPMKSQAPTHESEATTFC